MDILNFLSQKNINLNIQQRDAIITDDENILLLAVPGSGKTTVLVSKIAHLILNNNVKPDEILTLTFSRESAKDMKHRFEYLFKSIIDNVPKFSTIHSFCYDILKEYSSMYNRQMPRLLESCKNMSKSKILKSIYFSVNEEHVAEDELENLINDIGYYKNMMLNEKNYTEYLDTTQNFTQIMSEYDRIKKEYSLMDFDDMLLFAYDILRKRPKLLDIIKNKYKYINVDEAQDTSKIQFEILKLFAGFSKFFVVGDEDQCIYMFRGAYPQGLLNFTHEFKNTKILKIEHNYRSNKDIIKKANEFITINKNRYQKQMIPSNDRTNSIEIINLDDYNKQYEKIYDAVKNLEHDKTVGILYRNNESAIPIVDLFKRKDISYYIKERNLKFFSSMVVRDIMAFFTLAYNPKDIDAFEKIYYKCKCSKTVFLYAKYKIDKYESVFLACADCPNISSYLTKYFLKCHNIITTLKSKTAYSAILKIESELGYKEYLNMQTKKGLNPLNPLLKLNILKTLAKNYNSLEGFANNMCILEKSFSSNDKKESNITLSSIHSSKGLEFDVVFLVDFIESIIPTPSAIDTFSEGYVDEMESEARLFYVAFTRAKEKIIIYKSKFCNDEYVVKSRFITRIEDKPTQKNHENNKNKFIKLNGKTINHSKFGYGIITSDVENDVFKAYFKNIGEKTLSYSICIKNNECIE